jgi:hypothetical protein
VIAGAAPPGHSQIAGSVRVVIPLDPRAARRTEDYVPPVWTPAPGKQRTMIRLDIEVEDLEAAVADAVALGARVAGFQPQDNVRVLLDPAGHPFCLCRDDEG